MLTIYSVASAAFISASNPTINVIFFGILLLFPVFNAESFSIMGSLVPVSLLLS